MKNIKIENWNGHEIRFVWNDGEWWAVAKDVAGALDYRMASDMTRILDEEEKGTHKVSTLGGKQNMTIISETGIYEAVWNSQKPEAKEFKRWAKQVLKGLRQKAGLEQYQTFDYITDKNIQKELMDKIHNNVPDVTPKHYMKANTIANKAVSNIFGYPKMIKKEDMTEEMLLKREEILNDTVELMVSVEKFGFDCSVSKKIYGMYC